MRKVRMLECFIRIEMLADCRRLHSFSGSVSTARPRGAARDRTHLCLIQRTEARSRSQTSSPPWRCKLAVLFGSACTAGLDLAMPVPMSLVL